MADGLQSNVTVFVGFSIQSCRGNLKNHKSAFFSFFHHKSTHSHAPTSRIFANPLHSWDEYKNDSWGFLSKCSGSFARRASCRRRLSGEGGNGFAAQMETHVLASRLASSRQTHFFYFFTVGRVLANRLLSCEGSFLDHCMASQKR